jgi:hypothetical protein
MLGRSGRSLTQAIGGHLLFLVLCPNPIKFPALHIAAIGGQNSMLQGFFNYAIWHADIRVESSVRSSSVYDGIEEVLFILHNFSLGMQSSLNIPVIPNAIDKQKKGCPVRTAFRISSISY